MTRLLSPDHLYLTATGRLARRLRHEHRMTCLSRGQKGWESLRAYSLNDWLQLHWTHAWPEERPAHLYRRLGLLMEITKALAPPAPLQPDVPLCGLLDDTFSVLIRHGLDPFSGLPSTPLVEWRRRVCRRFSKRLASLGLFHPAELPQRIARGIREDSLPCPDSIVISGFDFPAPVESDLFQRLAEKTALSVMDLPERTPDLLDAVALPSTEQEVLYLVDNLVRDARTTPLHRIGVVVPDLEAYAGALEKGLQSITERIRDPDAAWYNISLGKTVLSFPLIQAALLPLQLSVEGVQREGLLAFLTSPYYTMGKVQELSKADLWWRKSYLEDGFPDLLKHLQTKAPEILKDLDIRKMECMSSFFAGDVAPKRPLRMVLDEVEYLWSALGFPVLSDEKDAIAFHHLRHMLDHMRSHLGEAAVNRSDLLAWTHFLAEGEIAQTEAPEQAGIQVLGLIESRGHDFDRLYLLGMSDRSLPRPVRPLPLLDAAERKKVLGGTPESQYDFAERTFRRLLSSSSAVTLLRPEQAGREPLSPSPFWPSCEKREHIDLWNAPGPVWIRTSWLRSAFDGLIIPGSDAPGPCPSPSSGAGIVSQNVPKRAVPLPRSLSVSQLERAVICPCRFFFEVIIGIEPLFDPLTTLYSMERGQRLHRVLSSFTRECRRRNLFSEADRSNLFELLSGCADRALQDRCGLPRWDVERRLWLEEDGLLRNWLEHEGEKWKRQWTVAAEELSFQDLRIPGLPFTLKGRIDRIDCHPDQGVMCWDYKSGDHPGRKDVLSRLTAPQLPLYMMALVRGAVPGPFPSGGETPHSAGYQRLKSPSDIRDTIIVDGDFDRESTISEWTVLLRKLGSALLRGEFSPKPYPFSRSDKPEQACLHCPFRILCEKGLTVEGTDDDEAEES